MTRPLRFLIADAEPRDARRQRRASVGKDAGETYAALLGDLVPGSDCHEVAPADADACSPAGAALADYDAVILTGSPLHLYEDTPEVRRQIAFMRAVFAAGTPSFGSCAGLQVATVAAGGSVRSLPGQEAGFARRITPTQAGRVHPLLAGRPATYDAPAMHGDEVEALPEGAVLLATNRVTCVQAAEIRCGAGVFWGVQYHPELSLGEVAAALRRDREELVAQGLAASTDHLEAHAARIETLGREPERRDLAWQLGLDEQVSEARHRHREIINFVERLVRPTREARGRG